MSTPDFRTLPLKVIRPSSLPAQVERRAYFNAGALTDLAVTIKSDGVHQPIVVRPLTDGPTAKGFSFEIVAGERRWLAAKKAGLEEIPARVRDLNDEQAEELQLVENMQRESLHEMAEAQGYESLHKRGLTVDEIAAKCGVTKSTVYARMKLLALEPVSRAAFYRGEISASVALLIARVPGAEQQERVLKFATAKGYHDHVPTYREVFQFIQDNLLLKLSAAPFAREDATLVPEAGACGPCPMRTGNAPDLFGDVKGADVCTNPACFQKKKAAHIRRELEKARAAGDQVIRGGEARRILPDSRGHFYSSDGEHRQLRNGYARPSDKCLTDPKKRTYAELAGKDAPRVMLQHPDTGRVEKVFRLADIQAHLKAKNVTVKTAEDKAGQRMLDEEQRAAERKLERECRAAIFSAIIAAAPSKLSHEHLAAITARSFDIGYGEDEQVFSIMGWKPPPKGKDGRDVFLQRLRELSPADLAKAAIACTVLDEAIDDYGKPKELEDLARRLGVNVKAVRKAVASTVEPAAATKKAKAKKRGAK